MAFDPDQYLATKQSQGFDPDAYLASKAEPPGKGESFLRGGAQGLTLGFADELEAALRSMMSDKGYKPMREEIRAKYDAAKKANPKTFMTGQVTGAIAPFVVAPEAAAPLTGLKGMAAMGAVQGLGESNSDDVLQNLWQMTKGAGFGTAAHYGAKVLEPGVQALSGKVAEAAQGVKEGLEDTAGYAATKAAGFTKLLRKKFGAQNMEKVGSVLNQGKEPIVSLGSDTADMIAKTQALKETAGGQIGGIMHDLDTSGIHAPDPGRIVAELRPSIVKLKGVQAGSGTMSQYRTAVNDLKRYAKDPTFERLQDLKNVYKTKAFPGGKSVAEGVDGWKDAYMAIARELERATDEGVQKLAAGVPKTVMPMETFGERKATEQAVNSVPDIYRGAKQNYGAAKMALSALKDKQAAEAGNKLFGLTDTIVGGAGMGASLFTHDPGTAIATMGIVGAKKLMEKQGPQAIAVGASKLAQRIQTNPAVYGKYAQTLLNAAQRGSQSLSAAHFILQQRDPEYRQMSDKLDKEEGQ